MIYLDNAATTGRKAPGVVETVRDTMEHLSVNAGRGSYAAAREASQRIDACREAVLKLAGLHAGYQVYFAPSATTALNQIILGLPCDRYTNIYVTPFEHNSVMRPVDALCRLHGCRWTALPYDKENWQLDIEEAKALFRRARPDVVFASVVSNTTGYVLTVLELVRLAHSHGARVVLDCAQALGAVDLPWEEIGADAMVFAGHKTLLGPYGAAGMILSDRWTVHSGICGGTGTESLRLEMPAASAGGLEPGSLDVPALCGQKTAVDWLLEQGIAHIAAEERRLIGLLEEECASLPKVRLLLPPEGQRSGIACFTVEGYRSGDVGAILDAEFKIAVRTGYQCAPLVHDWLGTRDSGGVVRASVSWFNTEDDIGALAEALKTL